VLAFQGRGPLAAFFSVAVARRVVAHRQRNRRDAVDDEVLLSAVADADVGEVKVLKQRYGAEISRCFERAIATLSPPRRLLLRQHYLDGLSLEAIATMKDVHRATAARWLADARAELLDQVRGEVSRLLGIARLEVDSLVRAIDSRLDLSARLFLSRADEKAVDS
jgi:RNA polymerase sigma-70 factor (ECF subfamily)